MTNKFSHLSLFSYKQDLFEECRQAFWACLPLSIFVLIKFKNQNFRLEELLNALKHIQSLKHVQRHGLSIDDGKLLIARLGYGYKQERIRRSAGIKRLERLVQIEPALVFPPEHAICVLGFDEKNVYFFEPDDLENDVSILCRKCFQKYWLEDQNYLKIIQLN